MQCERGWYEHRGMSHGTAFRLVPGLPPAPDIVIGGCDDPMTLLALPRAHHVEVASCRAPNYLLTT